ncbi:protein PAXX [Protopterus annectens]|uniref:protein PAXX n=1 Tax=Protopterus annectens TaxID=7888 RepID=UPI001CF9931E|nr:protein PAXX [Protopterus annectens]
MVLMNVGPTYTVTHDGSRYICYSISADSDSYNVCLSNAIDVWSTRFTIDSLLDHKNKHDIGCSKEYDTRLREAFEHKAVSLSFQDSRSTLTIGDDAKKLTFNLYKLPLLEARYELQLLIFGLADKVCSLGKELQAAEGAAVCSPEKSQLPPQTLTQRLFMQDVESRKVMRNAVGGILKKRSSAESLINPGRRKKQAPSGVDFEDA